MADLITFSCTDKTQVTRNFSRAEFKCPCGCNAQMIDADLVEKLQQLRDKLGTPIKITSGYRCTAHNKAVGGATHSRHVYGIAADWRTGNGSVNPVALGILAAEQFGGVGIYWKDDGSAFVHTDTRSGRVTWLCTSGATYHYTSGYAFLLPTVRRGADSAAERDAVKMIQRLLGLTADGVFGEKTEQAVKQMQEKHGLTVDGICGPESWRAVSGAKKYL